MPQLDTVYILLVYVWTWYTLYLTSQKVKTFLISSPQKKQHKKSSKETPMLPWT